MLSISISFLIAWVGFQYCVGKVWAPLSLLLILRKAFMLSLLNKMLAVDFSYPPFYVGVCFFPCLIFWEFLSWKNFESDVFLHILEIIIRFFKYLILLMSISTLVNLYMLKYPCILQLYSTWSLYGPFSMVLNCFLLFCWEFSYIMLISKIGCSLVSIESTWLCYSGNSDYKDSSFLFSFGKEFEKRGGIHSSLNVWWNSPVKPSGQNFSLLGGFGYQFDLSLIVVWSDVSISS